LSQRKIFWKYKKYGTGPLPLIAFHGFNRSPADFEAFEKYLGNRYSIIAPFLLFHGGSRFETDSVTDAFSRAALFGSFKALLDENKADNFSVLGHSFGGRLALNLTEMGLPGQKELFLLAPDGLRFHPGYRILTGSLTGRFLLKKFSENPSFVIAAIRALQHLGIYHEKSATFFINNISHASVRQKVYRSWMSHRETIPSLNNVAAIINKNRIRTKLFFGKYDTIIPVSAGKKFAGMLSDPDTLQILECGHRIYEKHDLISSLILKNP